MKSVTQQVGFRVQILGRSPPPDDPPITTSSSIPTPHPSNPAPQSRRYDHSSSNGVQSTNYAKPHMFTEEGCPECVTRDRDVADVDVTSPGIWERESDVHYNDLVRSEEGALSSGVPIPEDRPRSIGAALTSTNLVLWLTVNSREPDSKYTGLETYVRTQRSLVGAHAKEEMGRAYSQHPRSAYEPGTSNLSPSAIAFEETGRIRTHSHDARYLENGLIAQRIPTDIEEMEEREGLRIPSRARNSSRGSGYDLGSVCGSPHSPKSPTSASGRNPTEYNPRVSNYSQSSPQPRSFLSSSTGERRPLPRAHSTASFSDSHRIADFVSPNRKARVIGDLRTLSQGGWSRDSLAQSGISGSMMDSLFAPQQENTNERLRPQCRTSMLNEGLLTTSALHTSPTSLSQHCDPDSGQIGSPTLERREKKGLAKLWSIVTGSAPRSKSEHNHLKPVDLEDTLQAHGLIDSDCSPVLPPQRGRPADRESADLKDALQAYGFIDSDQSVALPLRRGRPADRDGGRDRSRQHSSIPYPPGTVGQRLSQSLSQSPSQPVLIPQVQHRGSDGVQTRLLPDSPLFLDSNTPVCRRLIRRAFALDELPSLIEAIFSTEDERDAICSLARDDAQTLIDVIDEALDGPDFSSRTRGKCLKLLYKMCGRHALLPGALKIPVGYDRTSDALYRGGYADVWRGEYCGQDVAVKVLRTYSNSDFQKIIGRFCKEVVMWRSLRHPNVLALMGVTMSETRFAMVSEWMVHGNINDFVKAHPEVDRLGLLIGVTKGLIYIHNQGMIHGDLKGANILIDQTGNARLADFGLLTIISDPTNIFSSSSRTQGGTARWMGPELIDPERFRLKDNCPTKYSDCYALGMVIYEAISGNLPFHQHGDLTVFTKVLAGERPIRGAGFTDGLWKMLKLCWTPRPNSRPSIEYVLQCLKRASKI